jgi:CarD family transcriptional regulator
LTTHAAAATRKLRLVVASKSLKRKPEQNEVALTMSKTPMSKAVKNATAKSAGGKGDETRGKTIEAGKKANKVPVASVKPKSDKPVASAKAANAAATAKKPVAPPKPQAAKSAPAKATPTKLDPKAAATGKAKLPAETVKTAKAKGTVEAASAPVSAAKAVVKTPAAAPVAKGAPVTAPAVAIRPTAMAAQTPAAQAPASQAPSAAAIDAAKEEAKRKAAGFRHGFRLNEYVVYPSHGVGKIVAIEEQAIAGMKVELFVITFEHAKMTMKVPTSKLQENGMRKLAEDDVVRRAMETLKGRARVKRTMWSRRAQEYDAKIKSGDLVSIAEVVRDLYRAESQPEQSYSERQLFEAALDRMSREIAVIEKLDERGAVQKIVDVLAKSAKSRKAASTEADAVAEADDLSTDLPQEHAA